MSITPVREALLRLVSVNALSVAPAQAFTVPEVGKRQLDEINRIRYELELMAVALAVENLTPQDLAELQELLEKLSVKFKVYVRNSISILRIVFIFITMAMKC